MSTRHCVVCDTAGPVMQRLRDARLPGWVFHHATSLGSARNLLRTHDCRVGVMALGQPASPPLAAIEQMLADCPAEWIAVVDRDGMREQGLGRLLGDCFHDFHTQPLDLDRLAATIGHAYGKASLRRRPAGLGRGDAPAERYGMIGASAPMLELYRALEKVVRASAPVLITGESGTGKELVARAIHRHSARAAGPFVAMNCGALPSSLIQSELFGYEKGAFTGAVRTSVGNIEAASGGVLFLDEIVDLPLEQQANLLRVLQEKAIVRLGSTRRIEVDVRVIAAANVDLETAVAQGRFRADLFYRLNVVHLRLPPLRERGGDVRLLAEHAFEMFADQKGPRLRGFSADALRALEQHAWPGNVRELVNRVHQAMIMSEGRLLTPADLGLEPQPRVAAPRRLEEARATLDRDLLIATLQRHRNNVSQTARELGVSRVTVYRMMNRHGIGS